MLSRAKGYETHVPLHLWNARNGVPRSIPVGNDPQAKGKVTGEMAPENQFFSTSKAGTVVVQDREKEVLKNGTGNRWEM